MARKLQAKSRPKTTTTLADEAPTAIYMRVSTTKQEDNYSLAAQETKLTQFCTAQGWPIAGRYVDVGTGTSTEKRPKFLEMMEAARNGKVKRIVVTQLDRFARSTKDFLRSVEELNQVGCMLVMLKEGFDTSTPHGKFALTIFAGLAELEASMIKSRTHAGRMQKASQGGRNGSRPPYGYRTGDGETYEIHPKEAKVVQYIYKEYLRWRPMKSIARVLNEAKIPTPEGGDWHDSQVSYVLHNGWYCGLVQYSGEEFIGKHPTLISRETYEAVEQRAIAYRRGKNKPRKPATEGD